MRGRRKHRPDGSAMTEIAIPVFGYKSHINTDRRHGFICKWHFTDAAHHDGRELASLLVKSNTGSTVWADTAYRSKTNERRIEKAGLSSKINSHRAPGKPLRQPHQRTNATHSKIRSAAERVFVEQKARMGLFVRTVSPQRERSKIDLANLAYCLKRLFLWERRLAEA